MIYRIAELPDWQQAQRTGQFSSSDLAAEGFIHASEIHQILRTANKYYRGKTDLHLLEIDDVVLGELVIREDSNGSGARFPHVYGPIPFAAIVRFFALTEDPGTGFGLPAGLAG